MRKLVIVCDDNCRSYGDYLAQLISLEDDTDENIIGTKDGEVVAVVWDGKNYTANSATIASNQYMLFIGQDKLIKEKSLHMNIEFSKFGMKYGWLGKQAFLTVEEGIKEEKEYDDFIKYAQNYQADLKSLLDIYKEKKSKGNFKRLSGAGNGAVIGGLLGGLKGSLIGSAAFAALKIDPFEKVSDFQKKIMLEKASQKQLFTCAVMKFYLDDLSKFLGL